jgi:hypothetical protein
MKRFFSSFFVVALAALLVPATYADDCSNATLNGAYSYNLTGWTVPVNKDGLLDLTHSVISNFVGTATFDGVGGFATTFYYCNNGVCSTFHGTGSYSVNPECIGKLQLGTGKNANHWGLAVSGGGNSGYMISRDQGDNISGTLTKQ